MHFMTDLKKFPKTINGDGFVLKAATDETHAIQLCRLVRQNQSEFKYIEYTQSLTTQDKAATAIQGLSEKWNAGTDFYYFIFNTSARLCGCVGLKIRTGGLIAEISYYLDKNAMGKGYVTRSITLLKQVFFNQGGHRLEIFCNAKNTPSVAVAQRLNAHLDGVLREYDYRDGVFDDVLIYSIIAGD